MGAVALRTLIAAALAVATGCQAPMNPASTGTTRPKATRTTQKPAPTTVALPQRIVEGEGVRAVTLIGKVKLISDKGAGIISNNSGNLISNNGGGYRVHAAPTEALLAEARLEVLDGDGNVLVDASGEPIGAVTDKSGSYKLEAELPAESLVLRVRLFPNGEDEGGELLALLHKEGEAERTIDLDTATTLGTAYVLEKYVKKNKAVLDKLPAAEAAALRADMAAAAASLSAEGLSYRSADLVAAAEKLRAANQTLAATLDRIEAILLAGQSNQGTGLAATKIPLGFPVGVTGDAAGNLYVLEAFGGRVRRIGRDGTVSVFAGAGSGSALNRHLGAAYAMLRRPDGGFVVQSGFAKLVHLTKDGQVVHLAGTGKGERGAVDVSATTAPLQVVMALALSPDGLVYIGEEPVSGEERGGRILFIDAEGVLRQVETPEPAFGPTTNVTGLAFTPDGTLWALDAGNDRVLKKAPGGTWTIMASEFETGVYSRLAAGPDGKVYLSESLGGRIWRLEADGTRTPVVGKGRNGYGGDGGPATEAEANNPSGMWFAPDGTLYFADAGNALVRRVGTDGVITTVAGTRALTQVGDALSAPINGPAGLAVDDQGRLILTEVGSHTIKRLENGQLTTIAGTGRGFGGDGGPATAAAFDMPTGIAFHGGALWVLDNTNNRLRKIDAAGIVTTVAGGGSGVAFTADSLPAMAAPMGDPMSLAFGPEGMPYWTDHRLHAIFRLTPDGRIERVAGSGDAEVSGDAGDGGPAKEARLTKPTGLAFDAAGNLYVADTGNVRIRKVTPDGLISAFAGLPVSQVMTNFAAIGATVAKDAALFGPTGLCFDAAGNLYFSEMGTTNIGAFAGFEFDIPLELLPTIHPRLRKVTPEGKLVTVTGPGTSLLADPESDNSLQLPTGLLIDKEGRLVIADTGLNQIKVLPKGSF